MVLLLLVWLLPLLTRGEVSSPSSSSSSSRGSLSPTSSRSQSHSLSAHSQSLNGVLLYLRGVSTATKRCSALAAAVSDEWLPSSQKTLNVASNVASLTARLSRGGGGGVESVPKNGVTTKAPRGFFQRCFGVRKRKLRVLCLDGGGMKGRNLMVVIRELERRCGKPVSELFDFVCGTSIGGCGALFVAHFGPSATERADDALRELQTRCFARTSPGRLVRQGRRCADERESLVRELLTSGAAGGAGGAGGGGERQRSPPADVELGASSSSSSRRRPLAFVVACRANGKGEPEPYLFRTYEKSQRRTSVDPLPGTSRGSVVAAVAATTAAPTYFPPSIHGDDLFDGGCVFNNPSLLALHEIAANFPDCQVDVLLSLGCGSNQPKLPTTKQRQRFLSHFLPTFPTRRHPHQGEESITHRFARSILRSANPGALYDRLDPPLPHKITPGEHREPVLANMESHTANWLDDPAVSARLDAITDRLLSSSH